MYTTKYCLHLLLLVIPKDARASWFLEVDALLLEGHGPVGARWLRQSSKAIQGVVGEDNRIAPTQGTIHHPGGHWLVLPTPTYN